MSSEQRAGAVSLTKLIANCSLLKAHRSSLPSQKPHHPTGNQDSAQEHGETIEAIANHLAGGVTMSDAKDDGCKQGENRRRTEMIESKGHLLGLPKLASEIRRIGHRFFPIAM